MALYKDFPQSPHVILDPGIRWWFNTPDIIVLGRVYRDFQGLRIFFAEFPNQPRARSLMR